MEMPLLVHSNSHHRRLWDGLEWMEGQALYIVRDMDAGFGYILGDSSRVSSEPN